MLTDINGLYDKNPKLDPTAVRYDRLTGITDQILQQTKHESGTKFGTGGMKSKILAAKTALSLGVRVFVGTGTGGKISYLIYWLIEETEHISGGAFNQ